MITGALVEAAALAERLREPQWVVVDCRFNLLEPEAGYGDYLRSHIPLARYAHLDRDMARTPGSNDGRHPLPLPEAFADRLGAWGIDTDSTVVVYDERGGAIAARLWWLLRWIGHERVALLNGGFAAWQARSLPVSSGVPVWQPARSALRVPRADWVASVADVSAAESSGALLVDVRAPERYRGEREPIDPMAGHVPGAHNWPFSRNLAADGRFRESGELRRDLQALLAGRDPARIIAMCGSGVTACHLLLAMQVAALGEGRLFAGSWSQWIRNPARPIRTGGDP
jgi:thiosulfate/3-mercaptopyruvate sulfurtransferase